MRKGRTKEEMAALDTDVKPELRTGSRTCQCTGCSLYFSGVEPFDRHHIKDREDGDVICRTPTEMLAIGMEVGKWGVWKTGQSKKQLEAA